MGSQSTEEKKAYQARYQKGLAFRTYVNDYRRRRYQRDPDFRLKCCLRARLFDILKRRKSVSVFKLLGCSLEFFKEYIAEKFTPGMSWENYGAWHLDHIKPCASFDLSNVEQQKLCFHFSNMQPLWAADNIAKKNKE